MNKLIFELHVTIFNSSASSFKILNKELINKIDSKHRLTNINLLPEKEIKCCGGK